MTTGIGWWRLISFLLGVWTHLTKHCFHDQITTATVCHSSTITGNCTRHVPNSRTRSLHKQQNRLREAWEKNLKKKKKNSRIKSELKRIIWMVTWDAVPWDPCSLRETLERKGKPNLFVGQSLLLSWVSLATLLLQWLLRRLLWFGGAGRAGRGGVLGLRGVVLLAPAAAAWRGHVGLRGGRAAALLVRVLLAARLQVVVVDHNRNPAWWRTLLSRSHALENQTKHNTQGALVSSWQREKIMPYGYNILHCISGAHITG